MLIYDGKYTIFSDGRIFSNISNKFLKPFRNKKGYENVKLKTGLKTSSLVHRLVAETFIPNPHNKPYINHIDGVPHNNDVSNLEWCTAKENTKHSFDILKRNSSMKGKFGRDNHLSKPVNQYTKDMKLVEKFSSIREASEKTGTLEVGISYSASKKRKTSGGFIWRYETGGVSF